MQDKLYVKLFGINLIRIKKRFENTYKISILGIPVFSYEIKGNKHIINLWAIYKTIYIIKKLCLKAKKKAFKTQLAKRYSNNEKIKILLVTERPGNWNFDYLYQLLKRNEVFDVQILVMPDPYRGYDNQVMYMKKAYSELVEKGYSPIKGYDYITDTYFDMKELNPDIIFYTDFGIWHYHAQYYITNFLDKITLLTDYGFSVMQDEKTCNFELNNLVDVYFRPTEIHKKMSVELMKNKGKNVLISGSPKLDVRFDNNYISQPVWKPQQKVKKKIIWAPHAALNMPKNMYQNNAFGKLYNFMFELAEKYKNEIQFTFRPHPDLKSVVIKRWGEKEAEEYYNKWKNLENSQLSDGGSFIDLFMQSDAMITDCCSFLAEYTAFNKPLFHTVTPTSRTKLNEFGEELYKVFYKPKGTEEGDLEKGIEEYIQNVVLGGNDIYKEQRTELVNKYFGKYNGKTASENMYDEIVKLVKGEK